MKYKTLYAENRHGDAVYKLEHNGRTSGTVAGLLFTTAHGEEKYNIDAAEYKSFQEVFAKGSSCEISHQQYHLKRTELRNKQNVTEST